MNVEFARSQFPSLGGETVYFDNGGGSQVLRPVLDRLQDYLLTSNVQHGASYEASKAASGRLDEAQRAMATLLNADDPTEIVMGPSTTALLRTLAASLGRTLEPGDQIVVTNGDHEANIGPWLELERHGAEVRFWEVSPDTGELRLDDLEALLGPRTRIVAVTHASNILGSINPIRAISDAVHAHDAWLCVDGVGFAPHRSVDVRALDADFYVFSFYKTFGPHHAVLYGRRAHLLDLPGLNHSFVPEDDIPYKFQPGSVNYELSYAMLGLMDYLGALASGGDVGHPETTVALPRASIDRAFDLIADYEERLSARLLDFLATKERARVVGSTRADREIRVPIISFVVDGVGSERIVRRVDDHGIGIRHGHFYSPRLLGALGLPRGDGVVRVSMVHYNTIEEIDRLTTLLDPLI